MGAREIRAGRAYVELATRDNLLIKGLSKASSRLNKWGAGVTMAGAKVAAGAAAAIAPLVASVAAFADTGSMLDDMSQRTGMSVEALSELKHAAEMSGTELGTVEKAVIKMQKALGGDLSKDTVETLNGLGLSATELQKLTPEEQFNQIAAAIGEIDDPTKRAATAMKLFGKSGTSLLPMIADMEALRKEARDLGFVMSGDDAQNAAKLGDQWDTLKSTAKWLAVSIGSALAPSVIAGFNAIQKIATVGLKWVQANKPLVVMIAKIIATVLAAGAALIGFGVGLTILGTILGGAATLFGVLGAGMSTVLGVIGLFLSPLGLVAAAVLGLAGWFLYSSGAAGDAVGFISEVLSGLVSDTKASFGAIGSALASGDFALAAKILWLTLKLQFRKGIAFLASLWDSWAGGMTATFREAINTIIRLWESATKKISSWILKNASKGGFFGNLALAGTGSADALDPKKAEEQRQQQIAIKTKLRDSEQRDLESAIAAGASEQEIAERKKLIDDLTAQLDELGSTPVDPLADAIKTANSQLTGTADAIQNAVDNFDPEADLKAAREEWSSAVAQANSLPTAPSAQKKKPDGSGLPTAAGVAATTTKTTTAGSFNAIVAAQLGNGHDYQSRIARATEKTAKNTENLDDLAPEFD